MPGSTTTTTSDHTAASAICRRPSMPCSATPRSNGTGRCAHSGASRPVPLHHRARQAQMMNGLYSSLDERWGSGHLRSLIDRVVLTPAAEAPDGIEAQLHGDLLAILALSNDGERKQELPADCAAGS